MTSASGDLEASGVIPAGGLEIEDEPAAHRIKVVLNWFEELKRLVPAGR